MKAGDTADLEAARAERMRLLRWLSKRQSVKVQQLEQCVAELLDLALDGEWVPYGGGTDLYVCPECGEFKSDGHDADCWKGATIAKAKGASDGKD
jgi:hypothetical protein